MTRFNVTKLDAELKGAGIPIDGVSGGGAGRIDFRPEATAPQRDAAAAIREAHDPTPNPKPPTLEERFAALEARLSALESK